MPSNSEVRYRISFVTGSFMVIVALIMDALQVFFTLTGFLALLSDLVTFIAIPVFGLWFLLLRVNYFSGSKSGTKIVSSLTSTIIELIPIVDAVPAITIGVVGMIWASRIEDRQKARSIARSK